MIEIKKNLWKKAILTKQASIREAIANLNEVCLKIVMIVSDEGRLIGIVSDGDVRRGLLAGIDLNQRVELIMIKSPLVSFLGSDSEIVLNLMKKNNVFQIPIVDQDMKVVGLYGWNSEIANTGINNSFVIMAGGFGKRLMPYTTSIPKPMVVVAGKPILEHIILRAKQEGFRNFIICLHYLSEIIIDYFQSGEKFGVNIEYIKESLPLGTAGALYELHKNVKTDFIVTNGDVITDIKYYDILSFHLMKKSSATMAVRVHEWQNPYGVVNLKDLNIVSFEEKPIVKSHINAGIYALNTHTLSFLKKNEYCDMPDLFMKLKANNDKLTAYPMHEPWLDIGRPSDLAVANLRLKR